ncbi:uncharacterized protein PV06_04524 [Exophiala oligosperma]|uniref:GPI anchored serine-threonine rich protein n=2 Tax=Chaetothyriales TaxID=34395 RepID=A0A0D2AUE8_9EURO|nr:uncharacterized protein PV06_04524 [Exophiala oligosperma]KAJ9637942.1 hypothetical protein H2204_004532 [Knufia peltigerae]KIW43416.1 hypothetical protein PV06_04524 [Exophiala oligosperma]
MRSFYFLAALLPLVSASWSEHTLLTRATGGNSTTSCESTDKACGAYCIPSDYTCCPDLEGGCSAGSTCQLGDNNVYGCCPSGQTCSGEGGAEFLGTSTASAATATKTTSSDSGAQSLSMSHGLSLALVAAGVVALL